MVRIRVSGSKKVLLQMMLGLLHDVGGDCESYTGTPIGWVYVGSHNFSEQAWGDRGVWCLEDEVNIGVHLSSLEKKLELTTRRFRITI